MVTGGSVPAGPAAASSRKAADGRDGEKGVEDAERGQDRRERPAGGEQEGGRRHGGMVVVGSRPGQARPSELLPCPDSVQGCGELPVSGQDAGQFCRSDPVSEPSVLPLFASATCACCPTTGTCCGRRPSTTGAATARWQTPEPRDLRPRQRRHDPALRPGRRTVLLTRQFRYPAYVNGHPDGLLIEAAAGLLDDDDPEARDPARGRGGDRVASARSSTSSTPS